MCTGKVIVLQIGLPTRGVNLVNRGSLIDIVCLEGLEVQLDWI